MSSPLSPNGAGNDDLIVDTLAVVAKECGLSIATLRREIEAGRGPKVTRLSARRFGVQRRHRRQWLDASASCEFAA